MDRRLGRRLLGGLDDLGRATGATATITPEMLRTGTRPYHRVEPPGFLGEAGGHARGHLIARLLGGSGSDPRNLVTLFQRPTNLPIMARFERLVANAVRAGEIVQYEVTPLYRRGQLMPVAVTLHAEGSEGLQLWVTILNRESP